MVRASLVTSLVRASLISSIYAVCFALAPPFVGPFDLRALDRAERLDPYGVTSEV